MNSLHGFSGHHSAQLVHGCAEVTDLALQDLTALWLLFVVAKVLMLGR